MCNCVWRSASTCKECKKQETEIKQIKRSDIFVKDNYNSNAYIEYNSREFVYSGSSRAIQHNL